MPGAVQTERLPRWSPESLELHAYLDLLDLDPTEAWDSNVKSTLDLLCLRDHVQHDERERKEIAGTGTHHARSRGLKVLSFGGAHRGRLTSSGATSPATSSPAPSALRDRSGSVLVDCWGTARCVPPALPAALRPLRPQQRRRPTPSSTPSTLSESRCSSWRSRRRVRGRQRARGAKPRHAPSDTSASGASQSCDRLRTPAGSWAVIGADLCVPEHDRRILESMALRRRREEESAERAQRAHRAWQRELEERRQQELEQKRKWRAQVSARRAWEAEESTRRMEAVKRSLRLSQQRLEEGLRLKDERAELRLLEEGVQRLVQQRARSRELAARLAEAQAKRAELQRLEGCHRRLLEHELRARRAQADSRRRAARDLQRMRAASANREWTRCRSERSSLRALQEEECTRALRTACRERHQRAHTNRARQRRRNCLRALQSSLERESRQADARALHDHLELGLQLWRERCAALQEGAALLAQERAREQREGVRTRARCSNQRRRRHHRALRARIHAEDQARQRTQRGEIRDKDRRICQLRRARERALEEAREQAYTTASLREDLRRTLSPETFDRKAARVELEMRISSLRSNATSPTPTNRSHIYLG